VHRAFRHGRLGHSAGATGPRRAAAAPWAASRLGASPETVWGAHRTTRTASRDERGTSAERRMVTTLGTGRRAAVVAAISADQGLAHSAAFVGRAEGARSRDHGESYLLTWRITDAQRSLCDLSSSQWYLMH